MVGCFVNDDVRVVTGIDFERLFRSEYPRLVALGIAVTGDPDLARDLAQETMARAHSHWSDVAITDVPEAWLTRVLKNLLVDRHRRVAVEARANERATHRAEAAMDRSIDDPSTIPESIETFLALLDLLPSRQRMIVALHYVDDLPLAEIAELLEVTTGTIKTQLWKARRTIERRMQRTTQNGATDA